MPLRTNIYLKNQRVSIVLTKEKMKGNTMTKKTIVFLVGVVVLALVSIAVYAATETSQTPTNDVSITNAEVTDTGVCCQDCDGNCEDCEDCDGNCGDCGNCDAACKGHGEGRTCGGHGEGAKCGGHGEGQGHKSGFCAGRGCGM